MIFNLVMIKMVLDVVSFCLKTHVSKIGNVHDMKLAF